MAKKGKKTKPTPENMPLIHPHAAGIDVGAEEHWVCVPADRDAQPVQKFSAFTCDLHRLADWLNGLSDHHSRDGIHRRVLDSAVSDSRGPRLCGRLGQCPPRQECPWPPENGSL